MAVPAKRLPVSAEGVPKSEYDRLAITLPRGIARGVRAKTAAGKAPSVSAYIAHAVAEKLERDDLRELLAEMAAEFGPATPEEKEWADNIVQHLLSKE